MKDLFLEKIPIQGSVIQANRVLLITRNIFFRELLSEERQAMSPPACKEIPFLPQTILQLIADRTMEDCRSEDPLYYGCGLGHAAFSFDLIADPLLAYEMLKINTSRSMADLNVYSAILSKRQTSLEGWIKLFIEQAWDDQDNLLGYLKCVLSQFGHLIEKDQISFIPSVARIWDQLLPIISQHCSRLKTLTFIEGQAGEGLDISLLLNQLPALESLKMQDMKLSIPSKRVSYPNLSLRKLDLSSCDIPPEVAQFLIESVSSQLQEFHMLGIRFPSLDMLTRFIVKGQNLEALPMFYFHDPEIEAILQHFAHFSQIKSFMPWGYGDNPDTVQISEANFLLLSYRCPNLEKISFLSCTQFSQTTIHAFIASHPHLRYVDFGDCDTITDDTVRLVGLLCKKLERLDLYLLESISVDALREAIPQLPFLKYIELPHYFSAEERQSLAMDFPQLHFAKEE
jgi:hypothetical protein